MTLSIYARMTAVVVSISCLALTSTARADLLGVHYDTGDLYSISTADASVTLIGNTGVPQLGSLEFAPDGTLYGFTTGLTAALYSINPVTAAATWIGALGLGNRYVFEGGLAFAPDGSAYGTNGISSDAPLLFSVNVGTGEATPIALMSGGSHDVGGLAWRDDGDGEGTLIGLDRILPSSLLTINPGDASTSVLSQLNPGVVPGDTGGMALLGSFGPRGEEVGYFTTAAIGGGGNNGLYWFDPYTGDHDRIGVFDPNVITGSGIGGLAIIPEPASIMLLGLGGLALLRRRRK